MPDSPFMHQMIKDTALRFGLAWNNTYQIPAAAHVYNGIRIGAILDELRHPANKFMKPGTATPLGNLILFAAESYIEKNGEKTHLTEKERDILLILLEADQGIISKEKLLKTVWGYASDVETHTLETHIYRLRHKIEADPSRPTLLVTAGEGYKLIVPVQPHL